MQGQGLTKMQVNNRKGEAIPRYFYQQFGGSLLTYNRFAGETQCFVIRPKNLLGKQACLPTFVSSLKHRT